MTTTAGARQRIGKLNRFRSLWKSVPRPSRLIHVFASLVGSQLAGAGFGLVFWTIAARAFTPKEVGIGAALIATMTLLSMLGVFGVGTLLLDRFKVVLVTDRRALLSTGLGVAGMGGALVASGWIGIPSLVHVPGALGELPLSDDLLLIGATAVAGTCYARDQASIGMGASAIQLRRNLIAAVLRIAMLFGAIEFGISGGQAILGSWAIGLIGSLALTSLRRHLSPRAWVTAKQRWHLVRIHWTAAIGHHGLTLSMVSSGLMLPVVAASIVPATEIAYFTQARLLSDAVLALPYFLTTALFATTKSAEDFRRKAPRTLAMGTVLGLSLLAGAALFGHFVLLMFGTTYAEKSLPLLLLLLCASPVLVIKDHFAVLRRLQGRRSQGALAVILWTAADLTGALAGGLIGGIKMLCVGWVVTSAACALIALPVLIRATRRQPTDDMALHESPMNAAAWSG